MNWENIKNQLVTFLKKEVKESGFKNVTLGLSGGLDSAIVALLCKEAFGTNLKCILMPSQFSQDSSAIDAINLCKDFNLSYEIIEIEPMLQSYINSMNNDKLRVGNYSARIRMSVLYDISARDSSLVIGTSNKSEILLGYGTIFGDIACAINPMGEIYKSDEYKFGEYLGVSSEILNKKPSADLWDGQNDEDELGYTYRQIDNVLKLLIEQNMTKEEILEKGFDVNLINMLVYRIKANAFKGNLPKIAKIKWS